MKTMTIEISSSFTFFDDDLVTCYRIDIHIDDKKFRLDKFCETYDSALNYAESYAESFKEIINIIKIY